MASFQKDPEGAVTGWMWKILRSQNNNKFLKILIQSETQKQGRWEVERQEGEGKRGQGDSEREREIVCVGRCAGRGKKETARETGREGECRGVWTGREEKEERKLTIDSG